MKLFELYRIALLEGEGLGTAYEYYVKLDLINRFMRKKRKKKILIYGLPEKYGYSVDFFIYSKCVNAQVDLLENRKEKLEGLWILLSKAKIPKPKIVDQINGKYDLILSSEVFHRNSTKELKTLFLIFEKFCANFLVFLPNNDNKAHSFFSGLEGKSIHEVKGLGFKQGYIDAPPFPPGIKKKKEIKNRLFIFLLAIYGKFELYFPFFLKKYTSHMIYIYK